MTDIRLRRLIFAVAIVGWIALLFRVSLIADKMQWDFEVYYYAAKAHATGLNPYDPYDTYQGLQLSDFVERWAPECAHFPYLPLSMYLFKPFILLSLVQAKYVFFFMKCGLLAYLFWVWQFRFLKNPSDAFFALFCLFAFNATIFLDIRSGNVSIIEQSLIWSAFLAFVTRRVALFCVLLCLTSVFKLTPILFGGLLLLDESPWKNRSVLILIISIIFVGFVTWLADPGSLRHFFMFASHTAEGDVFVNICNPATFSLVRFLSEKLSTATGISLPRPFQWSLYLAVVIPVLVLSYRAFLRLDMRNLEQRKTAVCLACLVYALVLPRFQDYQWILLLVPTYFIMLKLDYVKAYPVIFILAVLSAEHQTLPGSAFLFSVFWNYYPWAVAVLVWILYLRQIQCDFSQLSCKNHNLVSSNLLAKDKMRKATKPSQAGLT
jgi:hypothetical protein